MVHDEQKKRGFWNLRKVEDIIYGADGKIRGAVVRVYTGGKRPTQLRRSLAHLYPLEINANSGTSNDEVSSTRVEPVPTETGRPRRQAAVGARNRILAQTLDND